MTFKRRILGTFYKSGNSIVITIPPSVLEAYNIRRGDWFKYRFDESQTVKIDLIHDEDWEARRLPIIVEGSIDG